MLSIRSWGFLARFDFELYSFYVFKTPFNNLWRVSYTNYLSWLFTNPQSNRNL